MTRTLPGWILILVAVALAVWLVCGGPSCQVREPAWAWSMTRDEYAAKIDAFLVEFFARCSPRKLSAARRLAPVVLDESERAGINPAIVAAIVSYESTWDPEALGALGEVGLMQVMGLSKSATPSEQIASGIARLQSAFNKCQTVEGAISYYATGRDCKPYKGAKLRIKTALKIEEMQ